MNELLPRLLYVGDVPVESSYHGSALLHRLLESYPPEKLLVIESSPSSRPERRLVDVRYCTLNGRFARLLNARFHKWFSSASLLFPSHRVAAAERLLDGFAPQAILTVSHGSLWLTAMSLAEQLQIPMHMICHDEIIHTVPHQPCLRATVEDRFARAYRAAKSRFCVSPYMRDNYRERFGVDAQVLYPSRAANVQVFSSPPERVRQPIKQLRIAFAGTIGGSGQVESLRRLANAIEAFDGTLEIFGPASKAGLSAAGLGASNVKSRGLLSSNDLIQTLRNESDILFVPMSYGYEDRATVRTNFPSKLTDYTAAGLPILIDGPRDSSAVRWADEFDSVAVVHSDVSSPPTEQLQMLLNDHELRYNLATNAMKLGAEMFASSTAVRTLNEAISNL